MPAPQATDLPPSAVVLRGEAEDGDREAEGGGIVLHAGAQWVRRC
jgi:hypothetical protein